MDFRHDDPGRRFGERAIDTALVAPDAVAGTRQNGSIYKFGTARMAAVL